MRYFNAVLASLVLVLAISFGWSISSAITWWGAIDYMLNGSSFGWLFVTGLCLTVLRLSVRRWPIRAWLRVVMTLVPTTWLLITLALRGEWSILIMIAVSTAILVLLATPGSPKSSSSNKTPGAWRRRLRSLFVEPNATTPTTTTTTTI